MADFTKHNNNEQNSRLYDPYRDLKVPIRKLYDLPTAPEHIFAEEASKPTDKFLYYTGCSYLAGAIIGATKGSIEGLKAAEPGDTLKLRANRVLNSGGLVGRRYANSLGVLGLIFGGLESGFNRLRGREDFLHTVLAGLGTGALYKAAAGPRSAAIAGAIGGIAAAAAVAGKQAVKRYVHV